MRHLAIDDTFTPRPLAFAAILMLTLALAGLVSAETGATYTATSTHPSNTLKTLLVQPPASQNAPASSAGGVVGLAWPATPTAPGAGHTLTYLVLRGPVGGPYAQVGSTAALSFSDTPPADGTYQYVIQARVTGGGSFTSGNSAAQNGMSDRTAPTVVTSLTSARGASGAPVTVNLAWTAGTDALSGVQGYEVRWTNPVGTCPAKNTANYPNAATIGAATSYQISGLVAGSTYCAYLVTIDNVGNRSANSATTGPRSAR